MPPGGVIPDVEQEWWFIPNVTSVSAAHDELADEPLKSFFVTQRDVTTFVLYFKQVEQGLPEVRVLETQGSRIWVQGAPKKKFKSIKEYLIKLDKHEDHYVNFQRKVTPELTEQLHQPLIKSGALNRKLNMVLNEPVLSGLCDELADRQIWDQWIQRVTDLTFVAAKCAMPGGVQALLNDYSRKAELPYKSMNSFKDAVFAFERFVRKWCHILQERPYLTIQLALNEPSGSYMEFLASDYIGKQGEQMPPYLQLQRKFGLDPCLLTLTDEDPIATFTTFPSEADKHRLLSASGTKLRVWDTRLALCEMVLPPPNQEEEAHEQPITCVHIGTLDGRKVVSADRIGVVKLWYLKLELKYAVLLRTFKAHSTPVMAVAYLAGDQVVVSFARDGCLKIFSERSGESLMVTQTVNANDGRSWGSREHVTACSLLIPPVTKNDSDFDAPQQGDDDDDDADIEAALASDDDEDEDDVSKRNGTYGSKDGLMLLVGDNIGRVKLWSARTGKCTHVIESFSHTLLYQPPGRLAICGMSDGSLKLWQLGNRNGALLEEDRSTEGPGLGSGSDAGHRRYNRDREPTREHDAILARFELGSRKVEGKTHELAGHFSTPLSAVGMAGSGACTGGGDGQIKLWDLVRHRDTGTLTGHAEEVTFLHMSEDNKTCTSASKDNKIKRWAIQPPCEEQDMSSSEEETEEEEDDEDGDEDFEDEDEDDPDAEEDEIEEEEGVEQERYDDQLRAEHVTHSQAVQMIIPAEAYAGNPGRRGGGVRHPSTGSRPITPAKRAALEGPLGAGRSRRAALHREREQARHENQRMVLTLVANEIFIWGDMTRRVPELGLRGRSAWLAEQAVKKDIRERLSMGKQLVRSGKVQGGTAAAIPTLLHKPCDVIKETDPVMAVTLMPDNTQLLLGVRKDVKIWNIGIDDGGCKLVATLGGADIYGKGHGSFVVAIGVSQNCEWVVSGDIQGVVKLWNLEYSYCVKTFRVHKCPLSSIKINCGSVIEVSDNLDKQEVCWDVQTGEVVTTRDDGVIIAGDAEGGIVTLACDMPKRDEDQEFWHPRSTLQGHRHGIVQLVVAGGLIVSGDTAGLIKIWSLATGVFRRRIQLLGKLCNLQLVPTNGCDIRRLGNDDDDEIEEDAEAGAAGGGDSGGNSNSNSNNAGEAKDTGSSNNQQGGDSEDSDEDVDLGTWAPNEGKGFMLMTCTSNEVRLHDCNYGRFDVLMSMPSLEPLTACAVVAAAPPPVHTNVEDEDKKEVFPAHELAYGTFTGRLAVGRINWHPQR